MPPSRATGHTFTSGGITKGRQAMSETTKKNTTKKSTVEQRQEILAEAEELLADLPEMKPAAMFTQRDKSSLVKIASRMAPHIDKSGVIRTEDTAAVDAVMDALSDADEFFQSLASDPEAYRAWFSTIRKNSELALGSLLARYQRELGE